MHIVHCTLSILLCNYQYSVVSIPTGAVSYHPLYQLCMYGYQGHLHIFICAPDNNSHYCFCDEDESKAFTVPTCLASPVEQSFEI